MTEIFNNAVTSILLGIEDFQEGSDARMLSAARNYYAGLLLLGKECLIRAAPEADPMEVIGAKFEPIPNGDGGVDHEVIGYSTVDFFQLQSRFKKFGLSWPNGNIKKLQQFRNNLEHYHLVEPVGALREAIADSFPMIIDFFETLKEDPQGVLEDVWDTILEEASTFKKVQQSCKDSLLNLSWPGEVLNLDHISCRNCSSSLIGQMDRDNTKVMAAIGKCYQCAQEYDEVELAEMVVSASYQIDAYYAAKNGEVSPINTCPKCNAEAYVENGELSVCFACEETFGGKCGRCENSITLHEFDYEHPELCGYCSNLWERVMRE